MTTRRAVLASFLLLLIWTLSFPPIIAADQNKPAGKRPPQTRYTISYTPLYQLKADLDAGGSFDVQRHFLRFNANHMLNRQWMVGLGLRFDYENAVL